MDSMRSIASRPAFVLRALVLVMLVVVSLHATAGERMPANERGQYLYLVTFSGDGVVQRLRGAVESEAHRTRSSLLQSVQIEQAARLRSISSELSRSIRPVHAYLMTHSGMSLWLHPEEAEMLRRMDSIERVVADQRYELATFRGPWFIGADTVWSGESTPDGIGARGQGMVVGVLDSGLDASHPSFADAAECGFGAGETPSKLLSALDCSTTDDSGMCSGSDPSDAIGHGTHVAGTAVGNRLDQSADPAPDLPSGFTEISGVAPCAHLRAYKVCPGNSCSGAQIVAGMNSVLLHDDVDVMNFSISGGTDPWVDNDRLKLDLVDADVLVAAAAGNTSPGVPDPVGQVNHRAPWVLSVASVSHDAVGNGLLSVTGPGQPPAGLQDMAILRGSDSPVAGTIASLPLRHFGNQPGSAEGCTPGEQGAPPEMDPFPADYFAQSAALIRRGTCDFPTKISNAFEAGAQLVLIRNDVSEPFQMATPGQPDVPAYSMDFSAGEALQDFVDDNPGSTTISFEPVEGDILSGFSFRGPTPPPLENLTKPDVAAPGDQILAPVPGGYGSAGGTSMASPHVAGASALLRQVHPEWSVSEVASALATTAYRGGVDESMIDQTTPDEVGGGRIDVGKAAQAALVLPEQTSDFLAANPADGGDVRTLNLPALRDMDCSPECTWTRTLRNTREHSTEWQVSATVEGYVVTVSPSSFDFVGAPGETQELTITAIPDGDQRAEIRFGNIELNEISDTAPQQHLSVAVRGQGDPSYVVSTSPNRRRMCLPQSGSTPLSVDVELSSIAGYTGAVSLMASGLPDGITSQLPADTVDIPGVVQWQLEIAASATAGSHALVLEADDGGQVRSANLALMLDRQINGIPVPLGPPDEVSDIGLRPEFSWQSVDEVRRYQFELATDPGFNDLVVQRSLVTESFQPSAGQLEIGTEYFWRVRGSNACGAGQWSETRSLTTRLEPLAQVGMESITFITDSGGSDSQSLEISNAGTGNLVWQIDFGRGTSALAGAGSAGLAESELNERLGLGSFTVEAPVNGGTVVTRNAEAGKLTRGQVVGFRFSGRASGLSGTDSRASDTCMQVESPDGDRFTVGGSVGANAGCGERPWAFQGESSDNDGAYSSEHEGAFPNGTSDAGQWQFHFSNDWTGSTGSDIHWQDVSLTLLKNPWPYCENPGDVPWLSVDALEGATAAGETDAVTVSVDGSMINEGRHFAAICLATNDPARRTVVIPVTYNHGVPTAADALFSDRFKAE